MLEIKPGLAACKASTVALTQEQGFIVTDIQIFLMHIHVLHIIKMIKFVKIMLWSKVIKIMTEFDVGESRSDLLLLVQFHLIYSKIVIHAHYHWHIQNSPQKCYISHVRRIPKYLCYYKCSGVRNVAQVIEHIIFSMFKTQHFSPRAASPPRIPGSGFYYYK